MTLIESVELWYVCGRSRMPLRLYACGCRDSGRLVVAVHYSKVIVAQDDRTLASTVNVASTSTLQSLPRWNCQYSTLRGVADLGRG